MSHPAGLNLTDGMHAEPRCREDGELLLFPLFPQVLSHSSDSFLHRLNRAAFIASAAVQTMILRNPIRTARFDTALRTVIRTFSAADTAVRYFISFRSDFCVPDGILLPENRMYPEMKIVDLHIPHRKNDTDLPSCRPDIRQPNTAVPQR